ncbi:putative PTS system, fructose-specific IIABC component [Vibrio angustum S14]|uniref:protein-N(pi)-phosphohistidine--D-fructose phosphotransferase n=1 Tax=Photobacterium angustum (strain S14 / CCUG 15956) TaxID=314292 RepID=Q1ZN43_PHOAS|nr:PTS fructose transporter subunit EIIC [Photobacterium angustum]EAS63495.1 putative PTS system, fructose-specific IIABC component [Vibrio angustum S14] [Photobacterium angustum S14]
MKIESLITNQLICVDLSSTNKKDVFVEMATLLENAQCISDKNMYLSDVWSREDLSNTGFEDGIAIPHAKSSAVIKPAVAVGISRTGIEYGADNGELCNIFFMIASPNDGDNLHIEVLAQISSKLIEDGFTDKLRAAKNAEEIIMLFTEITPQKKVQPTIQSAQHEVSATSFKATLGRMKQHLLFGTSHMIPFIVAGGVLLSLSVMISGKGAVPDTGVLKDIAEMGIAGLTLFTVILGGYIAYSIADKPGLAPGMIGSWIAVQQFNTGFLGAIVVGFIAGFVVQQLKRIKLPDSMASLGSIFIYPLVGTFIVCSIVMWGIGEPIAHMMTSLNVWLAGMASSGKILLGAILGGMTAFDMGGPINKVATLFAQTQVNTQPWLMGGVGIAICVPPLGMALATILSPKRYKKDEREAGKAAAIMGMIGITEGAIPFAAADPLRVIPAVVVGGIVGNVIGFMFNVLNYAPWGGWIVLPVIEGKFGYIVGTIVGAVVTAVIVNILKKPISEEDDSEAMNCSPVESISEEGVAQVLAIISCPSGVAHTFLAAKSLEKAASKIGIKIKVETQGANGIVNRLTTKDVANAEMIIFAHDVAIKEIQRFDGMRIVDIKTKEAMNNAEQIIQSNLAQSKSDSVVVANA